MKHKEEFFQRRQRLFAQMETDAVAIVSTTSHQEERLSSEAYRQDPNFFYLTGFMEPEAVAVLLPDKNGGRYILFNRPHDAVAESWTGLRAGQDGARETYGADEAYSIDELETMLPTLLQGRRRIYCPIGSNPKIDQLIMATLHALQAKIRSGITCPDEFVHLGRFLNEMRLFKSELEIATMKKAVDISCDAHRRAMQTCRAGNYEYHLEAEFAHECKMAGSRWFPYSPIVGAGKNSCTLHYIKNDAELKSGDLVLIDAAAEYEGYSADITRTFPVNKKFSGEQRAIYELVLAAQSAALEKAKPGIPWNEMQVAAVSVLTTGLVDLGLLKGNVEDLIAEKAYFPFYFHNIGHWLGLETHDVGNYKIDGDWRKLQSGIVLTVEPGLYIAEGAAGVDERWWNIGVRIEDDVLITESGNQVLSAAAPKEIAEIEALMTQ